MFTAMAATNTAVFVAGRNGVSFKGSADQAWTKLGTGIPTPIRIERMLVANDTLYIGTQGFGVWSIAVPTDPALVSDHGNFKSTLHLNPQGQLVYTAASDGETTLEVFDVVGRSLALYGGLPSTGTVSGITLHSGLYFVRLMLENGASDTHRLLVP